MSLEITPEGRIEWRGLQDEREWLVTVNVEEGEVLIESGPEDPWARRHEMVGGVQTYQQFLDSPPIWVLDYPGMAELVETRSSQLWCASTSTVG